MAIGVFDTTHGDRINPCNDNDYREFMVGVYCFGAEKKQKIIYKPKWEAEYIGNNVTVTNESPEEVIKQVDFVIAMCFTNPAVEALAMGVPAIYYDATNKFNNRYFDSITVHSYAELKRMYDAINDCRDSWVKNVCEMYDIKSGGKEKIRQLLHDL